MKLVKTFIVLSLLLSTGCSTGIYYETSKLSQYEMMMQTCPMGQESVCQRQYNEMIALYRE